MAPRRDSSWPTTTCTSLLALVGAMVMGQTVMQLNLGLQFSAGQQIGKVGTWIVLGGIAVWLTAAFLRNLSESTTGQPIELQSAHT